MIFRIALVAVIAASGLLGTEPGFVPLFNAATLDGWTSYTPGIWIAREGRIIGRSPGLRYNDFLRTSKMYGDFELRAEFKLINGVGNSGIQFRSRPVENSPEVSGYQADIDRAWWGCLYDESRRNRVLMKPTKDQVASVRPGDWNEYVIIAKANHITINLNRVRVVDYVERDVEIPSTGIIALQVHSGPAMEVQFRNIRIRVIE